MTREYHSLKRERDRLRKPQIDRIILEEAHEPSNKGSSEAIDAIASAAEIGPDSLDALRAQQARRQAEGRL